MARPRHDPDGIKRWPLNLRVNAVHRALIEAAARANERSFTLEVTERLLSTFPAHEEDQLAYLAEHGDPDDPAIAEAIGILSAQLERSRKSLHVLEHQARQARVSEMINKAISEARA